MSTHKDRMSAARRRAATSAAQQLPANAQPPLDQSAIVSTNGEAKVVPNETSSHMRQKMAGEGNVQDYNPELARARTGVQADAKVYDAPGARNARPHLPEGNPNVRSQGAQGFTGTRRQQSHVRDLSPAGSRRAGEGNVQQQRSKVQDANFRSPVGLAGRAPGQGVPMMAPSPIPGQMGQPMQGNPMQPMQGNPMQPMQGNPMQPMQGNPPAAPPVGSQGPVPQATGPTPHNQNVGDLTVVVATFRRPGHLRPQLQALGEQTLRAADLWIWVNDWAMGAGLHDHEAEAHYTFFRSKVNLGPWIRFTIAQEVMTKYVLILDDDCFPGPAWVAAAVQRLEQLESQGETAVICAEGRVFGADDPSRYAQLGPADRPDEEALVDEGVKGWLIPRMLVDTINAMPRAPSPVGWGIHLAAALQHAGIFQLVLAYPENDQSTWGSLPVAEDAQPVSISATMPNYDDARAAAWSFYRHPQIGGWIPLGMTDDDEGEADTLAESESELDAPANDPEAAPSEESAGE